MKIRSVLPFFLVLFLGSQILAQETKPNEKRVKVELELDAYYSSLGFYTSLTRRPIPEMGEKKEWEVYAQLLKKFYLPRTLILETSINPLPYAGTLIKKEANSFYQSANVTKNLNIIESIVEGFEEPWALSFFLGDVVAYQSVKKAFEGKRHGYVGTLVSVGNMHIKTSDLILDRWAETEWKFKGDQFQKDRTLRWSYRFGAKFHENPEIQNVFYISFWRSRTDFKPKKNFLLNNSGFQYTFDFSQRNGEPIRHYFTLEKKISFPRTRYALSLDLGFVWNSNTRYSGTLASTNGNRDPFQIVFQPNIEF